MIAVSSERHSDDMLTADSTSAQTSRLEIAHVLFMDTVGYSKLRLDQQAAVILELNRLVNSIEEVANARRNAFLIARPTGDGMALLFFQNLLSPVITALEIDRLLKQKNPDFATCIGTVIRLRMGIHTGPVLIVQDINGSVDVAGEGIIEAQRVMDAADAGHILLTEKVAEGLQGVQPWNRFIHPLGDYHDKNDRQISLFTLVGQMPGYPGFGREDVPKRVLADRARTQERRQQIEQQLSILAKQDTQRAYLRAAGILCGAFVLFGLPGYAWYHASRDSFCDLFQVPACAAGRSHTQPSTLFPAQITPARDPVSLLSTVDYAPPVKTQRIRVPKIERLTFDEAEKLAVKKGLKISYSEVNPYLPDPHYAPGQICRQFPESGAWASPGTTIFVTESVGPQSEADDTPDTNDPLPSPPTPSAVSSFTGILIDARRLPDFDSRGPAVTVLDSTGKVICTPDYRVYEQEQSKEEQIRSQVGAQPFRCSPVKVHNGTWLVLNAEDSARLRKIVADNPDTPAGILCQIR